mgnify:CR=1 FL=1
MKTEVHGKTTPQSLVGAVRRFGENGVLYEVVRPVDDSSVMIRVLDTGEETSYSVADVCRDPSE